MYGFVIAFVCCGQEREREENTGQGLFDNLSVQELTYKEADERLIPVT